MVYGKKSFNPRSKKGKKGKKGKKCKITVEHRLSRHQQRIITPSRSKRSKDVTIVKTYKWWSHEHHCYFECFTGDDNYGAQPFIGYSAHEWIYEDEKFEIVFKRAIYEKDLDAICELSRRHAYSVSGIELAKIAYHRNHPLGTRLYAGLCYSSRDFKQSNMIHEQLSAQGDVYAKQYLAQNLMHGYHGYDVDLEASLKIWKYLYQHKLSSSTSSTTTATAMFFLNRICICIDRLTAATATNRYQHELLRWVVRWIKAPGKPLDWDDSHLTLISDVSAQDIITNWIPWGSKLSCFNEYPFFVQQELVTSMLCLKRQRCCSDIRKLILSYVTTRSCRHNIPVIFHHKQQFDRLANVMNWKDGLQQRALHHVKTGKRLKKHQRVTGQRFGDDIWGIWIWWEDSKLLAYLNN